MNFFDHKNLGNHLLQLCPKVVKHPVFHLAQTHNATVKHTDVCSVKSQISELNVLQSVIQCQTGVPLSCTADNRLAVQRASFSLKILQTAAQKADRTQAPLSS